MTNRRDVLKSLGLAAVAGGLPRLAFANSGGNAKFVLVVLRGAMDGLAVAAPYGDGNYNKVRGELALDAPGSSEGVLKLDGLFGLHPSLPTVHESFLRGDASIVHAVASPYRERSHFDGQDLLENGGSRSGVVRDGWLNRALSAVSSSAANESAIALAQNTPLVLRGNQSVTSWAPSTLPEADDSTLVRLQSMYADDVFFATRLEQALQSQSIANGMSGMGPSSGRRNDARQFEDLMGAAARFLKAPDGPSIAVAELGGWDTHANQGSATGALANRLAILDTGIAKLRDELAEHWDDTVVAVVTEFGRTVRVNGTRGTDHGTATAAMLVGGAVNGGKVIADWPGLGDNNLYANRDLLPTTDLRSLFKGILHEHLDVAPNILEDTVFPSSASAKPLQGLTKS